ncbi:hypothetical protein EC968_007851, partial [Mortierella alpina]
MLHSAPATEREQLEETRTNLETELQQTTTGGLDAHALRSGTTWREKGEVDSGYFFRAIVERCEKRVVRHLHHPTTSTLTSPIKEMLQVAADFYSNIYTPEPQSTEDTRTLLQLYHPQPF